MLCEKKYEGGPGKAVIAPDKKHFCRGSFILPPRLNYLVNKPCDSKDIRVSLELKEVHMHSSVGNCLIWFLFLCVRQS